MRQIFDFSKTWAKCFFRDRQAFFWTLFFPIILTTIFIFAFKNLRTPDKEPVRIGYCQESMTTKILQDIEIFQLEKIASCEDSELAPLFKEKKLDAALDREGVLIFPRNTTRVQIARQVLSSIQQTMSLGPRAATIRFDRPYTSRNNQDIDPYKIMFYSVIGMVALYSYFSGINTSLVTQANLSQFAARLSLSPLTKWRQVLSLTIVNLLISFANVVLLLLYLDFVHRQGLIHNWPLSLSLIFLGNLFGYSLGLLFGSSNHLPEMVKIMFGTILFQILAVGAGMVNIFVVTLLRQHAPFLDRYNPIAIITDQLIQINLYGQSQLKTEHILYFLIATLVMSSLALIFIRRKSYKSLEA